MTPSNFLAKCHFTKNNRRSYYVIESMTYNGDSSIATWTATGGNRPWTPTGDQRNYSNMFDGNPATYWVGHMPNIEPNTVTITFIYPVIFAALTITSRPSDIYQPGYQGLCTYADDVLVACTSSDRQTSPGEVITFAAHVPKSATKIELRYPGARIGVVAELEVIYSGRLNYFLSHWSNKYTKQLKK